MPETKRIPMTPAQAEDAIRGRDGKIRRRDRVEMNRSKVTSALGRVGQQSIIDAEDADYVVEIWDKASPINDVPAHRVFASRNDIQADGVVYLIKRISDNRILCFQPFKPGVGGRQKMTEAEANTIGADQRQNVANDKATSKILKAFYSELDKE